jgi:hypothetical protein
MRMSGVCDYSWPENANADRKSPRRSASYRLACLSKNRRPISPARSRSPGGVYRINGASSRFQPDQWSIVPVAVGISVLRLTPPASSGVSVAAGRLPLRLVSPDGSWRLRMARAAFPGRRSGAALGSRRRTGGAGGEPAEPAAIRCREVVARQPRGLARRSRGPRKRPLGTDHASDLGGKRKVTNNRHLITLRIAVGCNRV